MTGAGGGAGERNCIRGPQSVTGMSSTGARAREDSLILPTIRHPADPREREPWRRRWRKPSGWNLSGGASLARGARGSGSSDKPRRGYRRRGSHWVDEWVRTLVGVFNQVGQIKKVSTNEPMVGWRVPGRPVILGHVP